MSTLNNDVKEFLSFCQNQKALSAKTAKAYANDLQQYQSFCKSEGLLLNRETIQKYIRSLHSVYKPKTVKRKIATLKAFTHYLMIECKIQTNPFALIVTSFREPAILPRTIPQNVLFDLLKVAYQRIANANTDFQLKSAVRNATILELLFATGIRVFELCNLQAKSVSLDDYTICVYGKGSKERIIQIPNQDVQKILKRYYLLFENDIQNSGFFFVNKMHTKLSEQSVRNIINQYASLLNGAPHLTPHMFRHTFATLLLEEDVDIRYIQTILGHSSITTTQIYTHVATEKQHQILLAKHPRNKINL